MKILAVDDDDSIRDLLTLQLRRHHRHQSL